MEASTPVQTNITNQTNITAQTGGNVCAPQIHGSQFHAPVTMNFTNGGYSTQGTAPATGAAFINAKWAELVQRASGMESILDSLLMKNVLTDEQYNIILSEKTEQKMMRELIHGPLRASGNTGKNALYEVLMDQQSCMMRDLGAQ
ncbi:apoptosis-associated speck-like protein containing a CARD isoform X2 [Brachyhypopomus gauderio]|uniref:apoptosis-associated speck-like protein containing a CARD isoform X2 n=1 Tax=Brachyhypopomus gauderio TaxID=698409 RepID=UPI0040427F50